MTATSAISGVLGLSMLAAASVVAAAPTPTPAPASLATPQPLREIGRVRTSVCSNVVVHANGAISASLRNDAVLGSTVARLRTTNLDSADPLTYNNAVTDLDHRAGQLRDNAVRGLSEVQHLRTLANETKDPARKAELEKFADALDGALSRQNQMSADLNGYIAYLQAREMRKTPDIDREIAMDGMTPPAKVEGGSQSAMGAPSPFALWRDSHGSLREMSLIAASDLEARTKDVAQDESTAAAHAEGAVSGC